MSIRAGITQKLVARRRAPSKGGAIASKELKRPVATLLEAKKLRTEGQKRGTRYYASGGKGLGRKKAGKAKKAGRKKQAGRRKVAKKVRPAPTTTSTAAA